MMFTAEYLRKSEYIPLFREYTASSSFNVNNFLKKSIDIKASLYFIIG